MPSFGRLSSTPKPYQPRILRLRGERHTEQVAVEARRNDVQKWVKANLQNINTPAFKAWFKRSVVRGEDGRPLIQFHGTRNPLGLAQRNKTFSEFAYVNPSDYYYHFGSLAQATSRIGVDKVDASPVPGPDKRLEGTAIYAVFLSIQKPLRLEDIGTFKGSSFAYELHRLRLISRQDYEAVERMEEAQHIGFQRGENLPDEEGTLRNRIAIVYERRMQKLLTNRLTARGYDGLVYTNQFEGGWSALRSNVFEPSYAAFFPWQIKAINNVGTWSPKTSDIFHGL